MSNVTLKSSIYLLIVISAIAWIVLSYVSDLNLSELKDFIGLIPKVVSFDLLVIAIFVKWGWKYKIFRGWLVPFPDLNGCWVGSIYSDWKDPKTGKKIAPIPVMLNINQSFFHISCVMSTSEMDSYSYSEGFVIDNDRQLKQIAYSYTSKPRLSLQERSASHDGKAIFKIIEKPNKKLTGRYWTERLTKGEIVLTFHSRDLLEELPGDMLNHPVTENENLR